ncbi:MAG TPA: TIGR00730 family Rossman fold protein [Caldilineae bacterium]|nr:TIGR00730 family Rossman fold protein [Caldilineae bacterium]
MFKTICVFCGSNPGVNGSYVEAARHLGRLLAREDISLVFGGGMTGLMGALADAVLTGGGRAIGVIPDSMNVPRVVHEGVSELVVVDTMHTRKATMAQLSDAFIALPGGLGTFEELFETLTWSQLGYQPKPIGILNVDDYYDPLVQLIDHAVAHGFVTPKHRGIFTVDEDPTALLSKLQQFKHPSSSLWDKITMT